MSGGRTGQVFLEDYDVGIARTLGAEEVQIEIPDDNEVATVFAVRIDGVTGPDEFDGMIPVYMSDPEDAYQANLLPQIILTRGAITPQLERWFPGGHEYQVPAHDASEVEGPDGVTKMPTRVERKWWTVPYEISYDLHLRARLRVQADRMLRHVGRFFWARGQVFLTDSEGDERGYYAFQDSIDNLSEIADVADRLQGHTISLRVEGELDFNEPHLMPTTPNFTLNTGFK